MPPERFNPIFVVGTPRSGTTLLAVMLDRHSAIAMTPETAFYDELAPRIESPSSDIAAELAAWTRLLELDLDASAVVESCGIDREPSHVLATILTAYASKRGKRIAGEKTPQHLHHVERILREFAECRILCLQRDGRDVALSLASMPWWNEGLDGAVARWRHDLAISTYLSIKYPDRFKIVRYEHLVSEPTEAMTSLMLFLGCTFEPQQLVGRGSAVVLARSQDWKGGALGQPHSGYIGWRRAACGPEKWMYLNRALFDDLRALGYEQSPQRQDDAVNDGPSSPKETTVEPMKTCAPRLTACVITKDSSSRLKPLLAQLSTIADQLVVGVDESSNDDTIKVAAAHADVVFRFRSHGRMAPVRMMVFDYADGDWILSIDDDERLEHNFGVVIRDHLRQALITHCWFPRKTISRDDPNVFYRFAPWFPDWQLRLFRNDRSIVWKSPRAHSGYFVQGPGVFEARTSIVHLNHRLRSVEERAKLNKSYRATGATDTALAEYEASTVGPVAPAPLWRDITPEARPSAPVPPVVRESPLEHMPPWKAEFISVWMEPSAVAGTKIPVEIVVRNVGQLSWLPHWGRRSQDILLSYRLLDESGAVLVFDNERCPVPTIVRPTETASFLWLVTVPETPGSYIYEWDFVSEFECWFSNLGTVVKRSPLTVVASAARSTTINPSVSCTGTGASDKHDDEEQPLAKSK